jgi:hypothetical protein
MIEGNGGVGGYKGVGLQCFLGVWWDEGSWMVKRGKCIVRMEFIMVPCASYSVVEIQYLGG